jgi:hypothetical protein
MRDLIHKKGKRKINLLRLVAGHGNFQDLLFEKGLVGDDYCK